MTNITGFAARSLAGGTLFRSLGKALLALSLIILSAKVARAYPSFIGYSYTTCITCHYNSTGNGPLTDYGRALFAQEIAARTWIPKSVSDDRLAELSGFLPGVEIPHFRPSLKYRGLWLNAQTRSANERSRWIHMQRDVSGTFFVDPAQRTIFTFTYGLLDRTRDYYGKGEQTEFVSREHYLRFYATKELLVAVGLMDRVFGIKHEDHTAVNRGGWGSLRLGLNQDSQAHGVLLQYFKNDWDLAFHAFMGNYLEEEKRRMPGFSVMGEYEIFEKNRLGGSMIHWGNEAEQKTAIAIHDRWGLPKAHGSSIMAEAGVQQRQDKAPNGKTTLGNYIWIQALVHLTRGYNLISTIERFQDETKYTSTEAQRWTFGFLTFPFQRTEVRFTSVQSKYFNPEGGAPDDVWALQGQLHVSW